MNLCSKNLIAQEYGPCIDTLFFSKVLCTYANTDVNGCAAAHANTPAPIMSRQVTSWKVAFVSRSGRHIQLSDSQCDDIYPSKIFVFLVPAFPFLKISCMNTMYLITFIFYDSLLSPSKLYRISKLVPILLPVLSFLFGIGLCRQPQLLYALDCCCMYTEDSVSQNFLCFPSLIIFLLFLL